MGSFDLFSEKRGAQDRGSDSNVSQAFLKETDDLGKRESGKAPVGTARLNRQGLSVKDKMDLTYASLIVGSPLMLLGIGTFAMCDHQDQTPADKAAMLQQQQLRNLALANAALNAEKTKLSRIPELKPAEILIPTYAEDVLTDKKKKIAKPGERQAGDQVVFSDMRRNRMMFFQGKNWLAANKLLKLKDFIADQIKRLSQMQDYQSVCKLSSQLELLDKALKRLG